MLQDGSGTSAQLQDTNRIGHAARGVLALIEEGQRNGTIASNEARDLRIQVAAVYVVSSLRIGMRKPMGRLSSRIRHLSRLSSRDRVSVWMRKSSQESK
jgi:hypothetical protein